MKNEDELKAILFDQLDKYKYTSIFFKGLIEDRIEKEDWLDNPLVQLLIGQKHDNLTIIEGFTSLTARHDEILIESLIKGNSGKESEFDKKIRDLTAEIHAVYWLIQNGFNNIEKISKARIETPDLKASKEKPYIFEVKNLRAPDTLTNVIFRKIKTQSFLNPSLYNTKAISIDLRFEDRHIEVVDHNDIVNINKFISELNNSITNSKSNANYRYKKEFCGRTISISINCTLRDAENFFLSGPISHSINLSDPNRVPEKLLPLIRKSWAAIDKAVHQLTTYDLTNKYEKGVLINWEKAPEFNIDDDLIEIYYKIVGDLDTIIKKLNSKCFIKCLLN